MTKQRASYIRGDVHGFRYRYSILPKNPVLVEVEYDNEKPDYSHVSGRSHIRGLYRIF